MKVKIIKMSYYLFNYLKIKIPKNSNIFFNVIFFSIEPICIKTFDFCYVIIISYSKSINYFFRKFSTIQASVVLMGMLT